MKDKWLNWIIIILLVCILCLLGYFIFDRLVENDNVDEEVTYNVNDYIVIKTVDFGFDTDKLDVERVVFKNLDVSIVNDFINEQNALISMAKDCYNYWQSFDFEGLNMMIAYSDIWYQINGNILTIYYTLYFESAIGECSDIVVVNIDLENEKVVTNEELLKMGKISFEDIAVIHYNKTLDTVKKCSEKDSFCGVMDKDYRRIELEEFVNNRTKYINMIVNGLDGAIDCYIKDGKVMYVYNRYAIDILYLAVGKGGCFDFITVEIGKYE